MRYIGKIKELKSSNEVGLMTKDMRQSLLNIPNSYGTSEKAPIDFYLAKAISLFNRKGYKTEFCCSGHTNQKHCEVWDSKTQDFVEKGPEAYILFKEFYNIPGQEILHSCSRISTIHCGTLLGIKKACRKLYKTAQDLPNINPVWEGVSDERVK